jgi:peptidoglycan/xylan/chitin deacetylase (PgdA/CDA1 family)
MFANTPLVGDRGYPALVAPGLATLTRLSMLAWPWLLQRVSSLSIRLHTPLLTVGVLMVLHNFSILHPQNPWDYSRPRFADFIAAGMVTPGASYRVLTMTEREDGMVQLMQAGAVLAQEFFDESIQRRSFGTTEEYRCFLDLKHATHVLVSKEWLRRQYTNEVTLLDRLVEEGNATQTFRGADGTRAYAITSPPPASCAHRSAASSGTTHASPDLPFVALTFDDGLNAQYTEQVASILEQHGAHGTFFVVGQTLEAQAPLARRLIQSGHVLANHAQDHRRASAIDVRYETLSQAQTAFSQTVGVCPRFFRPPFGARTPFVDFAVQRAGMRTIFWDVEVADWSETDASRLAERVLAAVQPGSIVLLHDGREGTPGADRSVLVTALPAILDGLHSRGLTPVALDQLLGVPAYLERCS